ncbi:hypothetical protein DFR70_1021077 [Nocardia tenerifensis]|uniref:Uncharacterized protein n=2 Tax=Nocardia tenerifensis TaxID=228006 RepID=A0A318K7S4_9NOCA|nr:hypothetical protein DFR70_1021077 [Nocardia tenerifensis]
MVTYGSQLADRSADFVREVDGMGRDVDTVAKGWKGEGAAAASLRAVSEKLTGTFIDEVAVRVGQYFASYGLQLDLTKSSLLAIVDNEAAAAGMKIADDGAVTPPKYPGNPPLATIMQGKLNSEASGFQERIKDLLKVFGEVEEEAAEAINKGVERLEMLTKSPAAAMPQLSLLKPLHSTDGRYQIEPLPWPAILHDDTFIYNTKSGNFDDWLNKQKWMAKLHGGEYFKNLDDATALYRHYWDNNGKPKKFDYDEAYNEDKSVKYAVDWEISRSAVAADQFVRTGRDRFQLTGQPVAVGSKQAARDYGIHYPVTENWQKAIGGYQQFSHSTVRVEGNRVTMDITVEAQDYYDFDNGKSDLGTGAKDSENGRFTEIGWAKPFETHGRITRTLSWEVGHPPSTATVDGGSEPQRNPGREDRTDNRNSGDGKRAPDNDRDTGAERPK